MDNEFFGRVVKEKRLLYGMTQKELGKLLYVSDKAISKWERGVSLPDILKLIDLAKILKVDVSELLSDSSGKKEEKEIINDIVDNILFVTKGSILKRNKKYILLIISITLIVSIFFSVLYATCFIQETWHKSFYGKVVEKTDEGLIVKEVIAQNTIVGVFNEVLGEEEYIIQYDDIEVESEKKEISEIKNIQDNSYIKIWYIGSKNIFDFEKNRGSIYKITIE